MSPDGQLLARSGGNSVTVWRVTDDMFSPTEPEAIRAWLDELTEVELPEDALGVQPLMQSQAESAPN